MKYRIKEVEGTFYFSADYTNKSEDDAVKYLLLLVVGIILFGLTASYLGHMYGFEALG